MKQHRYMMIACAVLSRECYHCASISKNSIDVKIIEQGLHDIGEERMSSSLQAEIDAIDTDKYDAILLAYGLCNNGVRTLQSSLPIVLPRAHDCITLLMGSKSAYMDYFNNNPGTFFQSVGWTERAEDNLSNPKSTTREMGMSSYEDYVNQYGEENAKYLMETLNDHLKNYSRLAYIDTGLPNTEEYEEEAKLWAKEQGWDFSKIQGNTSLISKLMAGDWNKEEFLIVDPGQSIEPSHDDGIVKAG